MNKACLICKSIFRFPQPTKLICHGCKYFAPRVPRQLKNINPGDSVRIDDKLNTTTYGTVERIRRSGGKNLVYVLTEEDAKFVYIESLIVLSKV